jgi:16S rRNA (guanine966-N2)-methyltransferase
MRVIAGTHRGRRLQGPQGSALRPTSDRVREALFSILGNRLPESRFLDLYAGTGAVGIEALSRGVTHVTSVESDAAALHLLRHNLSVCQIGHQMTVQAQTVQQFLSRPKLWNGPYDIVFADPPYANGQELESLFEEASVDALFAMDAWLVVEHGKKNLLPDRLGRSTFLRHYRYGDTTLSLFSFSGATPS